MVKPMKSANATFGGNPTKQTADLRRPSESQERLPSARDGADVEPGWARCEESTPPEAPVADRRRRQPARSPQLRTGVVRRLEVRGSQRESGVIERPLSRRDSNGKLRPAHVRGDRGAGHTGEWRCLEWGQEQHGEQRMTRNSKVTIVQLSRHGDLLRQNGPDVWLPEAGDFMNRMARLVAQAFGFARCRSVCLRSSSAVLTVAEAGDTKVVAVSGPLASMTNVLRRAGLE
jgi:hypothetical protein